MERLSGVLTKDFPILSNFQYHDGDLFVWNGALYRFNQDYMTPDGTFPTADKYVILITWNITNDLDF